MHEIFFPQKTLKLLRGQIQCKAEITLGFGQGCLGVNQAAGAELSLWILVPSSSGFCEAGRDDAFSWVPTELCRRLAGHPCLGTFHLPLWGLSVAWGQSMLWDLPGACSGMIGKKVVHHGITHWINFLLSPAWRDCPEKQLFIWALGRGFSQTEQLTALNTNWFRLMPPLVLFPSLLCLEVHFLMM